MAEAVARDRVRDPVECVDRDSDLVMHRGNDMDMFQLERDFNVPDFSFSSARPQIGRTSNSTEDGFKEEKKRAFTVQQFRNLDHSSSVSTSNETVQDHSRGVLDPM
ncbi:hypothetical protein Syun_021762 [Stephania yunnanensis]|uniref:Uncharacterized protein n=1 Tax=Stephania yunnanensis TaxID=152371 RepID=A0AAP0IGN7_9MAGN